MPCDTKPSSKSTLRWCDMVKPYVRSKCPLLLLSFSRRCCLCYTTTITCEWWSVCNRPPFDTPAACPAAAPRPTSTRESRDAQHTNDCIFYVKLVSQCAGFLGHIRGGSMRKYARLSLFGANLRKLCSCVSENMHAARRCNGCENMQTVYTVTQIPY